MKILVLTNSNLLSLPAIKKLKEDSLLAGVVITKKAKSHLYTGLMQLGLHEKDILVLGRKIWVSELSAYIKDREVDTAWVFTFPWIIPDELLQLPKHGFINYHFGLLPKYKGADPIFWQLKNQEEQGGVTVHLMTTAVDEGPVLVKKEMRIIPGENYGLHCKRLGEFTLEFLGDIRETQLKDQKKYVSFDAPLKVYDKKPQISDFRLDWQTHTADEIESIVNATNPKYQGAQTFCEGYDIRILEVTPVDMQQEIEAEPGKIVYADVTYGLVVACLDNRFLRITVVHTAEGFQSGVKLFSLGFSVNHTFK